MNFAYASLTAPSFAGLECVLGLGTEAKGIGRNRNDVTNNQIRDSTSTSYLTGIGSFLALAIPLV
jgi:hypothetical protein